MSVLIREAVSVKSVRAAAEAAFAKSPSRVIVPIFTGTPKGKNGGFHGTTLEDLGSAQLAKRVFEKNKGNLYFDSAGVALGYAHRKIYDVYGKDRWFQYSDGFPVLTRISSNDKTQRNDPKTSGLHAHDYFPSERGEDTKIVDLYAVNPDMNPDEFAKLAAKEGGVHSLLGIEPTSFISNFIFRTSRLAIRY